MPGQCPPCLPARENVKETCMDPQYIPGGDYTIAQINEGSLEFQVSEAWTLILRDAFSIYEGFRVDYEADIHGRRIDMEVCHMNNHRMLNFLGLVLKRYAYLNSTHPLDDAETELKSTWNLWASHRRVGFGERYVLARGLSFTNTTRKAAMLDSWRYMMACCKLIDSPRRWEGHAQCMGPQNLWVAKCDNYFERPSAEAGLDQFACKLAGYLGLEIPFHRRVSQALRVSPVIQNRKLFQHIGRVVYVTRAFKALPIPPSLDSPVDSGLIEIMVIPLVEAFIVGKESPT
ncbi:uncharacterized protein FFB20_00792 [Fusarium fujikuroi]|nr:uncharacterized protein FFB20_00792 [Fusarium fujikuroi]SCO14672.1 uncharacterized protein FFC1_12231 [Fusarium fujikuroi]